MKILTVTAYSVVFVISLFLFTFVIYNNDEEKVQLAFVAYCQLHSVGEALNQHYKLRNQYPNEQNWQKLTYELIAKPSCNSEINYINGQFSDVFGNKFIYDLRNNVVNLSLQKEIIGIKEQMKPRFDLQMKNGRFLKDAQVKD